MRRVAKITVSLPNDLLAWVDRRQAETGQTRSDVVRRALERELQEERERELDEQYRRGYREQPDAADELGWADPVALEALADLAWEAKEADEARPAVVGESAAAVGTPPGPVGRAKQSL